MFIHRFFEMFIYRPQVILDIFGYRNDEHEKSDANACHAANIEKKIQKCDVLQKESEKIANWISVIEWKPAEHIEESKN